MDRKQFEKEQFEPLTLKPKPKQQRQSLMSRRLGYFPERPGNQFFILIFGQQVTVMSSGSNRNMSTIMRLSNRPILRLNNRTPE